MSVMTLDHKAAYLNTWMPGPPVEMMLTDILCVIDPTSSWCDMRSGWITLQLKRALCGCVQSAILWYEEHKSTSSWMIFTDDLYEIRSFTRSRRSGCRGEGEREGVGMVG